MSDESIGVGIIGLGFMGQTHLGAYRAAQKAGYPCQVVAVCDHDAELCDAVANTEPFTEATSLLNHDRVQLVSICTHTESHADLAIEALQAGKHVLVEKPIALGSHEALRVTEAARAAETLCMPAMCLRFWPGWTWLKEQIEEGTLGAVKSAVFQRLSAMPQWASEFYADVKRSGGALVDLHIHDADFIRWCFGDPEAVLSTGSLQHLTTLYRYPNGPEHVVAEGGWNPGISFRMSFQVIFEEATVEYALHGDPPLQLQRDGNTETVPLDSMNGYDGEIRYLLDCITGASENVKATMQDAERVVRLLECERQSLGSGLVRFDPS